MYQHVSYYTYSESNMSNAVVAFFSGIPTYLAAIVDGSPTSTFFAIATPFILFFLGKAIDVVVRIVLDSRNEKRRLNGIKQTHSSDSDGN